jgi:prophage antirepressor-like protein
VQLFDFLGHTVRVTTVDNEPWFVAADVLDCLGIYRLAGVSRTIRHLGEDEKR